MFFHVRNESARILNAPKQHANLNINSLCFVFNLYCLSPNFSACSLIAGFAKSYITGVSTGIAPLCVTS